MASQPPHPHPQSGPQSSPSPAPERVHSRPGTGDAPSVYPPPAAYLVNAEAIHQLRDDLAAEARRLGFVSFGVTDAEEDTPRARRLEAWLAADRHGSMGWMQDRVHHRRSPQGLWPEASRVIALGMTYAPAADPLALAAHPDRARISVYAQGADFHDVVKKALKALARWLVDAAKRRGLGEIGVKVFVDTAPVMEKPLGAAAGLGWQGKHTNLVSREHGSWLFLGAIYTTLPLPVDAPGGDSCGSCRACQDACPTQAFPAPYQLDARRCVSYLTIELKGPIPEEFRAAIGNRIYGCDDCLAVCPWNKFAQGARAAGVSAARRTDRAPAGRLADAGRRRVSRAVFRFADQTHRPRPVCPQVPDRRRQQRRSPTGGGGRGVAGRS